MKTYMGSRYPFGGATVIVITRHENLAQDDSAPLHHHVRHSSDGFEWGYHGSGPADLALAILADYLGAPSPMPSSLASADAEWHKVWWHYQHFKRIFIAPIQSEDWSIMSDTIKWWLEAQEKGRRLAELYGALSPRE